MIHQLVTLFFIEDAFPTDFELEAAAKLGTRRFRNARLAADPSDPIEDCDRVAGAVPDRYLDLEHVEVVYLSDIMGEDEKDPPPPPAPATAPETKEEKPPSLPPAPWAKNA